MATRLSLSMAKFYMISATFLISVLLFPSALIGREAAAALVVATTNLVVVDDGRMLERRDRN